MTRRGEGRRRRGVAPARRVWPGQGSAALVRAGLSAGASAIDHRRDPQRLLPNWAGAATACRSGRLAGLHRAPRRPHHPCWPPTAAAPAKPRPAAPTAPPRNAAPSTDSCRRARGVARAQRQRAPPTCMDDSPIASMLVRGIMSLPTARGTIAAPRCACKGGARARARPRELGRCAVALWGELPPRALQGRRRARLPPRGRRGTQRISRRSS